ncbi:uncharacterized protein PAC_11177 [Phialocephala subalpina]|uniref:Uncharacterized protein n=1 Tax=Phialocephala subalpina TaxID=576137 RepID=A0A1L7X8E2_9HELO|nr:uncharacterized protein PAC_11177 [Phialocephala subalpina]
MLPGKSSYHLGLDIKLFLSFILSKPAMPLPRQYPTHLDPTSIGKDDIVQICNGGGMTSTITTITTVWSATTGPAQIAASLSHTSRHDRRAIIALAILFTLTLIIFVALVFCICRWSRSRKSTVAQGQQEVAYQRRRDQINRSVASDGDSTVITYSGRKHRRRHRKSGKGYNEAIESEGDAASFIASQSYPQFPEPAAYFPPEHGHHVSQAPAVPPYFNTPIPGAAEREVELMNDASEVGSSTLEAAQAAPSKAPESRRRHSKGSESLAKSRSKRV